MKNFLFIGSSLGVMLLAGAANAELVQYKATLSGANEVPAVTTDGTGTADVTYNTETQKISGSVTYSGLSGDARQAHVHKGGPTVADGPISFDFGEELASPIEFTEEGSDPLDPEDITALEAGELYVNIHTDANPGGEIRGQLLKVTSEDTDGGTDAGSSGDNTSGGTDNTSSGGSSKTDAGATTSGGAVTPTSTDDDSGCSTTGSSPTGSGLAVVLGVGLAVGAMTRGRRKK